MPNIRMLHVFLAVIIVIALFYMKISGEPLRRPKKNNLFLYLYALTVSLFVMSLIYYPEECYRAAVDGVDT